MKDKKSASKKISSLAELETLFFRKGKDAAAEALAEVVSPTDRYYKHLKVGGRKTGGPIVRTDAGEIKTVKYFKFDPPSYFESAFQIMLVTVNPDREEPFLYHDGEEIVIPIEGPGIHYDFFWAKEGLGNVPRVYPDTPVVARPGDAARIQPQIPHRAWGAAGGPTKAWMITRPLANTAAQIYIDSPEGEEHASTSRQGSIDELERSGAYALRAWGISEALRLKRMRNDRRIAQVAKSCGIDAAHLSKIEGGTTNVTFNNLVQICKVLDMDLTELIAPPRHPFTVVGLNDAAAPGGAGPIFEKPPAPRHFVKPVKSFFQDHFVHPIIWNITKEEHLPEPDQDDHWWPSCWIVLKGGVTVHLEFVDKTTEPTQEVLSPESVLHLRAARQDSLRSYLMRIANCSRLDTPP